MRWVLQCRDQGVERLSQELWRQLGQWGGGGCECVREGTTITYCKERLFRRWYEVVRIDGKIQWMRKTVKEKTHRR